MLKKNSRPEEDKYKYILSLNNLLNVRLKAFEELKIQLTVCIKNDIFFL